MIVIGFLLGFALTAPTLFAIGFVVGCDARRERVRYVQPSLRREVSR